ncbi:MAG TPA: tryptophan--tRNA ligase [Mycobacteriales bacterium]|jgi:tryptophanyl-tRNA synthetase|nr:tryptophan--tRNA ligase [Mycobacteriales bacterium]
MTDHPVRPRVLSGIQPTGTASHLGNYLGAVRRWVGLQDSHDAFFFIPDLHAITVRHDPAQLRRRTLEAVAELMAAGLDPSRCTIFVQSHVPEHAELAWILSCVTGYGEAARMTQFKDKAARDELGAATVGLFNYPVLMASDILLYQADEVPVGADQTQHLELTRNLAQRFNKRFGEVFTVPKPTVLAETARIADLQDPAKKMSKSLPPAGTLLVTDPPKTIVKKIKSAVTDTGREVLATEDKPGITNLLGILSGVTGESIETLEKRYAGSGYGQFKADVADAVVAELAPVQERFAALMDDPAQIHAAIAAGAARAREVAGDTIARARDGVGFLPPGGADHWPSADA